MSIANFIPEVWSTRLLRYLDASLVYAQPTVVNREWEGEIANAGDTVHIQKVNDPTIVNYVKGTPMTPERPDGTTIPLTIDRDKGFYVQMDDLDAIQVNIPLFQKFVSRSGYAMGKVVDSDVSARMVAGAHASNVIGTDAAPVEITFDGAGSTMTFYEFAVEARRRLDVMEAPEDGRWMAVHPDNEATVLLAPGFVPAGANEQRTGKIGTIAGFDILKTTRTPTSPGSGGSPVPNRKIVFGVGNYATTFANQLVKTEAERLQGLFEDAVKGRNVWGAKIVEPETLGYGHVKS